MIPQAPDKVFAGLFEALHQSGLWADGKTITDAIPLARPEAIMEAYHTQKNNADFDIKAFFYRYFKEAAAANTVFTTNPDHTVAEHIERLWEVLKREADEPVAGSSLIPLPHPYIVPGGRFNEIYYWDSYFTMLGLQASGRVDMITSMVQNFAYLIDQVGFIPNGNRSYFLSRSQPPFFACMIDLLAQEKGDTVYMQYLPQLEKEYAFWMLGAKEVSEANKTCEHSVFLEKNTVLHRYYDRHAQPRAEMYGLDVALQQTTKRTTEDFFLHVRAACESGWDFSARWFADGKNLSTIETANYIPIDLNCLLYFLEKTLAKAYQLNNNLQQSKAYTNKATQRKEQILYYCWNEAQAFFTDYDFVRQRKKAFKSLAGIFPLFFNIATPAQAAACADVLEKEFLQAGGLRTTTVHSGEQWDAPNGWAPLQWVAIQGLRNYGFDALADTIKNRWINLNQTVFQQTGKLLEKYDVENIARKTGGGEYPVQDGFGWTNGVLLKLMQEG